MAEGKFVISAQNRIKEGLDAAQRDLGTFTTAAENLGKKLEAAFTATAIVAGLKKLGEATFDCYKEFGEAERRLNTLKIALDNNDASIRRATSLIEGMSKMTLASKDDIEGLVSELAALGKSDDEIEAITRASVNLSNVTGKDLNWAFTLVNATYSGTAGKLDKLIPQIGDLTKEQLAAGGATNLINERFGELSRTIASNDISQNLKSLSDSFGDLKENIGGQTASFFAPVVAGIQSIVTAWNNAFQAQEDYKKNALTIKDVETKSEGERLQAALANAVRDRETALRAFNMAQLTTDGAYKIIGGKKEPIYTPETAQQAGAFGDLTSQYFKFNALAASFRLSFENFKAENPNWNTPRTTTTGGAPIGGRSTAYSGVAIQPYPEEGGAYAQSYANLGVNQAIKDFFDSSVKIAGDARDDLESYGWNAAMLAKPVIEFRDDLESYGWDGLAETAFDRFKKQWAKSVDEGLRPEEGGAYSPNYAAQAVREDIAETFQYWERVSKDFRDDLESYDWEGLIEAILPTDGGGFRAQGQSTIAGPTGGGGLSAAAQIASNMSFIDTIGKFFGDLASGAGSLISSFSSIKMLLDPISVILQGFMSVIGPLINNALQPLLGILTIVGQVMGAILAPILEALAAVTAKVAEGFVWFYNNALRHVANGFIFVFNILANSVIGIANTFIDIINWFPDWLTGGDIARISERRNDQGFLQEISLGRVMSAGGNAISTATSTASESASYRTQSITINIYQNAAVVGTGGITEFARMIKGELIALDYYGRPA